MCCVFGILERASRGGRRHRACMSSGPPYSTGPLIG
jgi:hypothetical protein